MFVDFVGMCWKENDSRKKHNMHHRHTLNKTRRFSTALTCAVYKLQFFKILVTSEVYHASMSQTVRLQIKCGQYNFYASLLYNFGLQIFQKEYKQTTLASYNFPSTWYGCFQK